MKVRVAPWKRRAHEVVITAARKWRPNLHWRLSPPSARADVVTLEVSDDRRISASIEIDLRAVWKGSHRRDFSHVNDRGVELLDKYYQIHEDARAAQRRADEN